MYLFTVADLKTFLEKTDTAQDTLLLQIVNGVSARVMDYLNRGFGQVDRTELFNGGRRFYYVKAFPIDLAQPPVVLLDGVSQTIDSDVFVYAEDGYFEFRIETPRTKPKNISISYTGGFAVDGADSQLYLVPDGIKYPSIKQAAYEFRNRDTLGVRSVGMPDGSVTKLHEGGLLPEVKQQLRPFRRTPSAL